MSFKRSPVTAAYTRNGFDFTTEQVTRTGELDYHLGYHIVKSGIVDITPKAGVVIKRFSPARKDNLDDAEFNLRFPISVGLNFDFKFNKDEPDVDEDGTFLGYTVLGLHFRYLPRLRLNNDLIGEVFSVGINIGFGGTATDQTEGKKGSFL